jgi:pimeloyl-ACP methyl ester carboxylesterase
MARATVDDGLEIEYDTFGDPADPTLLLVCGFTSQMISWRAELCQMFAGRGLHVVRYDNRDCGLSTKLEGRPDAPAVMAAMVKGETPLDVPYTLSDMAADGIGLLDHLGVDRAAVLGVSMGGMIVQTMAIEHPQRISALISVMSTTGDLSIGKPTPEALEVLLAAPPSDRDAYIAASAHAIVWASKRFGSDERMRELAAQAYDRSFCPDGAPRQLAAIYASGDRSDALAKLDVPTLVIHGRDDTLIAPDGGMRTAELIPTANLFLVADMGHDLPEPLWPLLVDTIVSHIDR